MDNRIQAGAIHTNDIAIKVLPGHRLLRIRVGRLELNDQTMFCSSMLNTRLEDPPFKIDTPSNPIKRQGFEMINNRRISTR
ncbi:hypothetical protein [Mucilaginibacter lappiensis]|uniref:hypothetical protein n=1 Tax=Mucilaginibacter lappiensis TaxID=354630 RepID=UPI003D26270D